jgi:hypothetical protein
MIEIRFEDDSAKKFVITDETTVQELIQKIEQKLYLQADLDSFALYDSFTKKDIKTGFISGLLF